MATGCLAGDETDAEPWAGSSAAEEPDPDPGSTGEDDEDDETDGAGRTDPLPQCPDLVSQMTASGIATHLEAFYDHAMAHDGNRAAGTPGYEASADYVAEVLGEAGYEVRIQPFDFERFQVLGAPLLAQLWPESVDYPASVVSTATYSPAGEVVGPLRPIDLSLGLGNTTTSGCEPDDFDDLVAGDLALIQRGGCTFAQKALNAEAAGADGVLIFNQGESNTSMGVVQGTLGAGSGLGIPVLFTNYASGEALAGLNLPEVWLRADTEIEVVTTRNVIVDTAGGDPNDLVMYGAHLDSVPAGPGINDNGTGSAALLEVARAVAPCALRRRIRFAWWGAEEVGLLGSEHYVAELTPEERSTHRFYLNFDMVGSPNYARLVYDGDGSAYDNPGPGNSGELEALFTDYFNAAGLATGPAAFNLRSDYAAFVQAGIPSGGVFTGAEGTKSEDQAAMFGGQPGEPFDACYHQDCDGLANVDLELATQITGAIAHSVEVYAFD